MKQLLKGLALACALALWPLATAAQDASNILPTGIWENSGRFKVAPAAIIQVGKDSIDQHPCLIGFSATCAGGLATSADIAGLTAAVVANTAAINTPSLTIPPTVPTPPTDTTYTHAKVAISSAADTTLVAGVSAKQVTLHAIVCTIDAADNLTFKSNATAITPTFRYPSGGGIFGEARAPTAQFILLPTTAADPLVLTTTTTAHVDCDFWYRQV